MHLLFLFFLYNFSLGNNHDDVDDDNDDDL